MGNRKKQEKESGEFVLTKEIKLKGLSVEETKKLIPEGTTLLGYMGSHSHNTYIPPSEPDAIDDIDLMGICILPFEQYMGLGRNPVLRKRNSRMNNEEQEIQEGRQELLIQLPLNRVKQLNTVHPLQTIFQFSAQTLVDLTSYRIPNL